MRARNIKPGFFTDEDLVECSFPARILFAGLPCLADRMGRMEYRPKKIKMLLMPADDVDCSVLLDELAKAGKIKRYEAEGKILLWIPGFLNHQEPHRNEKTSILPRHPEDGHPEEGPRAKSDNASDQGQNNVGPRTDALALIPDSGFLIPDSGIIPPPTPVSTPPAPARTITRGNPGGGVSDSDSEAAEQEMPDDPERYPEEFQNIVQAYPAHRVDFVPAYAEYEKLRKRRDFSWHRLETDLSKRTVCDDWTRSAGQFVPGLSRYLRERQWMSPIPDARAAPPGQPPTSMASWVPPEKRKKGASP